MIWKAQQESQKSVSQALSRVRGSQLGQKHQKTFTLRSSWASMKLGHSPHGIKDQVAVGQSWISGGSNMYSYRECECESRDGVKLSRFSAHILAILLSIQVICYHCINSGYIVWVHVTQMMYFHWNAKQCSGTKTCQVSAWSLLHQDKANTHIRCTLWVSCVGFDGLRISDLHKR